MANREFWVRLRPRNEGRGIKLRRYLAFGIRFDVTHGWYRVPEIIVRYNEENQAEQEMNIIEYLRAVRNDNDREDSPLAFDVCTEAEALEMDEAAKRVKEAAEKKAANPNPIDLVTSELRRSRPASVIEPPKKRGRGRPPKAKPPVVTDADV